MPELPWLDLDNYDIIDISLPVDSKTAAFPGDIQFSRNVTLTYADSNVINLSSFTMSPHVGTHADSPIHIYGDMDKGEGMASQLPLGAYMGQAQVIDLADCFEPITSKHISSLVSSLDRSKLAPRLLFRTRHQIRYDVFEDNYASFTPDLIEELQKHQVKLVGIDTPSVDPSDSKGLETHHALHKCKMSWLENLDLTHAKAGFYTLIALPLKFSELEASPVRAILLKNK
ncbi:MAG: cyclase family protein [Candidatus Melainabacteria bacterium]|nr:cyclase family protein [Candidatus Melainabacteria bacterium]